MLRKSLVMLLIISMMVSIVGCTSSDVPASNDTPVSNDTSVSDDTTTSTVATPENPMVFKLSHTFLSNQPMHYALVEVAENIEERSNGAIKIEVYENSQIPNGIDGVEQNIRGAKTINVYDIGCVGDWVPDYNAVVGPMLFDTQEEFSAFCETDFVKKLNDQAEKEGIKVIALDYCFGFRNVGTNKKPVLSIDDMKGLKIRVPKSTVWIETFKALGASPTALGWSEIHNGIQTNVIEAMESSTSDIYGNQFWEILNHITLTKHFLGTSAVMLSSEVFDSLSADQQQIIVEEFKKGAIKNNELSDIAEAEAQDAMEEKGVQFYEIDLSEFKEASKAYYENMPGLSPNVYDEIMAELEIIRSK